MTILERINFSKFNLRQTSIQEVLNIIRNGDYQLYDRELGNYSLAKITNAIRTQSDSERQNDWKAKYLPAVSINGTWDGNGISDYSCYTVLDFDYINSEEDMTNTFRYLRTIPYVVAIFRTLKPYRLKAIIKHDNTDPSLHKDMYSQLVNLFGASLLDTSCSNLSRKHYLVWDKDIWINSSPVPFHYRVQQIKTKEHMPTNSNKTSRNKSPQSIISILNSSWHKNHPDYWKEGNRANSIFRCACLLCEYGVPEEMSEYYFLNGGWIADNFDENEVIKQVHGAYRYKKEEYGTKEFI